MVSFLGHVITNGGIVVDPGKVRDVLKWEPSQTVSEIKSSWDSQATTEGL